MSFEPFVFIVTHARDSAALFGTTLVFGSLRKGFPTAKVIVLDNESIPEVRRAIRSAAQRTGCEFRDVPRSQHFEHVKGILAQNPSAVLLDPDVVFWDSVEGFDFGNALMAGRYIPPFLDPVGGVHTVGKLHTSLLFLPDLRAIDGEMKSRVGSLVDPITPVVRLVGGKLVGWDTCVGLYSVLRAAGRAHHFTEAELDHYDHLFVGTHPEFALHLVPELAEAHDRARRDIGSFRGAWREQDEYFAKSWSVLADSLAPVQTGRLQVSPEGTGNLLGSLGGDRAPARAPAKKP